MKKILLLTFLLFIVQNTFSQKISIDSIYTSGANIEFKDNKWVDITKATPENLIKEDCISSIENDHKWYFVRGAYYNMGSAIVAAYERNIVDTVYFGQTVKWGNNYFNTSILDGKLFVEFADPLIDESNAKNYRYHVILNDTKEIIPWTIPQNFRKTNDGKVSYAYLGKFDYAANQVIRIEIYNVNDYADRSAFIADWRKIQKFNPQVLVQYRSRTFQDDIVFSALLDDSLTGSSHNNFIETTSFNDKKLRLSDSLVDITFEKISNDVRYRYRVILKRTIDQKTETLDLGLCNPIYTLDKIYWDRPGKYEISFTPELITLATPLPQKNGFTGKLFTDETFHYSFSVLPPLHSKISFSLKDLLLIIASIILLFTLAYFYFRNKNKKKMASLSLQKESAKWQLGAIHSQLNPHFMFNALAGIQNLMNKNEIDSANRYLGKFARLTRNVLDNTKKDLISIDDERSLLEDYLQMEQLRFHFQYSINIDKDLNILNTEIPAMLLQPFIENSVNHGINNLKSSGNIIINFIKNNKNLEMEIIDNGSGFDVHEKFKGLGLQLSKSRIALLNTVYKDTPVELNISTNKEGTKVVISLYNWL
jgi:two-component system LytT family sensor kinase